MKLLCPELNEPIHFYKESRLVELILENKRTYANTVKSLVGQMRENLDELWSLYDNETNHGSLNFCKSIALVLDPFSYDVNIHSVTSKINEELLSIANDEDNYLDTNTLKDELAKYAHKLLQKMPEDIEIAYSIDIDNLLKALHFQVLLQSDDILDSLYDYLCVLTDWGSISLTVFIGLRSYVDDVDMQSLIDMLIHKGINVLFIEGYEQPIVSGLRRIIVDESHCVL